MGVVGFYWGDYIHLNPQPLDWKRTPPWLY